MFDIISAKEFFSEIVIAFNRLKNSKSKRVADLLFVILGLNHLREWIAPGFKDKRQSAAQTTDAERFYEAIFENQDWKLVNEICNQSNHKGPAHRLGAEYGLKIGSWESMASVRSFDDGPPSRFTVDGSDIEPVLARVIDYYEANWFGKAPKS